MAVLKRYTGSEWEVVGAAQSGSTARGTLSGGYAQVTANQGSITTTDTDLTGLSVTVTVNSGERIKITGRITVDSTVTDDTAELHIKESTTVLTASDILCRPGSIGKTGFAQVILTPSAGSHTYKLALQRVAGTGTLTMAASSGAPAFILVEGIGT